MRLPYLALICSAFTLTPNALAGASDVSDVQFHTTRAVHVAAFDFKCAQKLAQEKIKPKKKFVVFGKKKKPELKNEQDVVNFMVDEGKDIVNAKGVHKDWQKCLSTEFATEKSIGGYDLNKENKTGGLTLSFASKTKLITPNMVTLPNTTIKINKGTLLIVHKVRPKGGLNKAQQATLNTKNHGCYIDGTQNYYIGTRKVRLINADRGIECISEADRSKVGRKISEIFVK